MAPASILRTHPDVAIYLDRGSASLLEAADANDAAVFADLRWYIGGLLFLSTVINYIDRQTLSVLAPMLKDASSAGRTPISRDRDRVSRRVFDRADGQRAGGSTASARAPG